MNDNMRLFRIKKTNIENIYAFLIIASPILIQYYSGIPGIMLGELLLILACAMLLLLRHFKLSIKSFVPYINFWTISLFLTLITTVVGTPFSLEAATRCVRIFCYCVLIFTAVNTVNVTKLLKYYKIISYCLCIYVVFQTVFYFAFNIYLPTKLLPINWNRTYDLAAIVRRVNIQGFKACGFFQEQGYVSRYLFPGVVFSLCGSNINDSVTKENIDIRSLVLYTIGIIVSFSSQGIVVLIFTYSLVALKKSFDGKKINFKFLAILVFGICVFVWLWFGGFIQASLGRVINLNASLRYEGSSFGQRLFRGYYVYGQLPFLQKLIGIGIGNVDNYVLTKGITTVYDGIGESTAGFANCISWIMISVGLIGLIFAIIWAVDVFRHTTFISKIIMLQFIIMMFYGEGINNYISLFFLTFIYCGYIKTSYYKK